MLRFEHISKDFKAAKILDDLSFEINTGELVAIIGSSGCGKTTLLKMMNRLISPTSGKIYLGDTEINGMDVTSLRRNMGYVIQQTGLFMHMTVAQNIGIIPQLKGCDKKEVAQLVHRLLEMVGLSYESYANRYPSQLSGGQQQRIGVARAFTTDPEVILMDEPFSALDPITRLQLQGELIKLHKQFKKTIVFVTHDIDEAIRIADRICILYKGKIEQFDTPETILQHPRTTYVSQFVGENRIRNFPQYLTVENIMNTNFVTCTAETAVKTAKTHQETVFVVDEKGEFTGMLCAKDSAEILNSTAQTVFKRAPLFLEKEEKIGSILDKMEQCELGKIPVLSHNKPIGFVSAKSFAQVLFDKKAASEDDPS